MKKPSQHQIDTRAKKIFEDLLPDNWVFNPQVHDYGKDYVVEPASADDLTGESFWVQLKGCLKPRHSRDKKSLSFSLKKKHAAYYLDKVHDLPVFLVLASNNRNTATYVFLQQYLAEKPDWRRRKSVRVYLPLGNDVADTTALLEAIRVAKRWLKKRHPLPLSESLADEHRRLTEQDPRCDVKISYQGGKTLYEFQPKEPFRINMTISGHRDRIGPKIESLSKGELVAFEPGDVTVEGSNLLRDFNETGGSIQFERQQPASLDVILRDDNENELITLLGIAGEFKGGMTETTYYGFLKNSPFRINAGPFSRAKSTCPGNFWFKASNWNGQPLLSLAYFDQLHRFFMKSADATSCESHWIVDGNTFLRIKGDGLPKDFFGEIADALGFLHLARKVCRRFKIAPIYSDVMWSEEFGKDVEEAHALLFEGGWKQPVGDGSISATVNREVAEKLSDGKPHDFRVIDLEVTFTILDYEIPIGDMVRTFTAMTVEQKPNEADENLVDIVLRGTADSVQTVRLADDSPFTQANQ